MSYMFRYAYYKDDSPVRSITTKSLNQAFALAEAFIHDGLEDEGVLNNILFSSNKNESSDLTTFSCNVDLYNGLREFFRYLLENYERYADLKSAAEALIKNEDVAEEIRHNLNVNAISVSSVIIALRDLALGEIAYLPSDNADFTVTVDKSGILQELRFLYYNFRMSVDIYDQNRVQPDESTLKNMQSKAQSSGYGNNSSGYIDAPTSASPSSSAPATSSAPYATPTPPMTSGGR